MGRTVPYDPEATCDVCGAKGAYDFYGDFICTACAEEAAEDEEYRNLQL